MDVESHLLNRLGLIIIFISFWFVTPEILGEERLKSIGSSVLIIFIRIYWLVLPIVVPIFLSGLPDISSLIPSLILDFVDKNYWICGIPFSIFVIYAWVFFIYTQEHADDIVNRLLYDKNGRRRLVIFGGILFVIGSILQFMATY